jgi:hypothetical protein
MSADIWVQIRYMSGTHERTEAASQNHVCKIFRALRETARARVRAKARVSVRESERARES